MSPSYKNEYEGNVVILLGAGASANFGCPTTAVFLEYFSKILTEEENKFLWSLRTLFNVKDIEHIVEILDTLQEIEDLSTASSLHGFFLNYGLTVSFVKSHNWPPTLEGQFEWKRIIKLAKVLEKSIIAFTFSQYQRKPEFFDQIKNYYGRFFSLLRPLNAKKLDFEIFTTNYDYVMEDFCSQSGHFLTYAVLNRTLQPRPASADIENYFLTKLHGSLNWVFNKQTQKIEVIDVQFPVPPDSALYENNEFVLFGRKPNTEEKSEYADMFDRFREKLAQANICIVVGFAFRHPEINRIINESLETNSSLQLFIVSRKPTTAIRNLISRSAKMEKFLRGRRIIPVKGSFGTGKALELLEAKLSTSLF